MFITRMAMIPKVGKTLSLVYDFKNVPYATGIRHIHSPDKMHASPFFKIEKVDPPKMIQNKTASICFTCSTAFVKNMCVRMWSSSPDECKMVFFRRRNREPLYHVKFSVLPMMNTTLVQPINATVVLPINATVVLPIKTIIMGNSHRLLIDIQIISKKTPFSFQKWIRYLMPVFVLSAGEMNEWAFHEEHFIHYRYLAFKEEVNMWAEKIMCAYFGL